MLRHCNENKNFKIINKSPIVDKNIQGINGVISMGYNMMSPFRFFLIIIYK